MFCTRCGRKNPDDAKFCAGCGNPLTPPAAAEESTPDRETVLLEIPAQEPQEEGTQLLSPDYVPPEDEGTQLLSPDYVPPEEEGTRLLSPDYVPPEEEGTQLLSPDYVPPEEEGTQLLSPDYVPPEDEGTQLLSPDYVPPEDKAAEAFVPPTAEEPNATQKMGAESQNDASAAGFVRYTQPETPQPPVPPEQPPENGEHFEAGFQPEPKKSPARWLVPLCIGLIVLIVAGVAAAIFFSKQAERREIREAVDTGQRYLSELGYEQAIVCFNDAIAIDPQNTDAYLGLAQAYAGAGSYVDAEVAYRRLLELDAQNTAAYQELAELYFRLNELEKARDLLEQAIQQVEDEEITYLYGETHPEPPTFSLEPGVYQQRQMVEILPDQPGHVIYYTIDGSEPNENSLLYSEPIILKNGETTIKAVSMSSRGYLSETAEAEYDMDIARVEVEFEDPVIRSYVCDVLGYSRGATLYNEDVEQVTSISIVGYAFPGDTSVVFTPNGYNYYGGWSTAEYERVDTETGNLETLADLRKMPFLRTVQIAWQENLDISGLSQCSRLEELSLIHNDIRSISPLSGLTNLHSLSLSQNRISDISGLSGLTGLQSLSLNGNQIEDLSALSGLSALTYLDISDNRVESISALSGLSNLSELWMYENRVADFSPLTGLSQLRVLMLRNNPIGDMSPLQQVFFRLNRIDVDVMEREVAENDLG